ncbi:site-specific DNA-methyltransferase, partial [Devosia sp.]|uniref:site-specific DNA-methyltransferase n=1 Tax=Devosia sp. TaxID=1871048 RepID=UPI002AFEAA18
EIFDRSENWIGTVVWKNVTDNNPTRIAVEHEYILCFSKNKDQVEKVWKSSISDVKDLLVQIGTDLTEKYPDDRELAREYAKWYRARRAELWPLDRYKYIDRGGVFTGSQSVHNPGKEGYRYDVIHPETQRPCKQPLMGYRFPKETMDKLLADGKILFGEDENKIIELKLYAQEYQEKLPSVVELDGRTSAYELRSIFPDRKKPFDYAKPSALVEQMLSFATKKDAIILDSFAGSGTTGHAVLRLNAKDGGQRRFIMVEGEDYVDDLTAERVRRVIGGVPDADGELGTGLGGSFTYCTLGEPVELDKVLTGEVLPPFEGIGAALYHMATNTALDPTAIREHDFYLGEADGQHIWLIYRPDLDWLKTPEAALTLARAKTFAATDPEKRHLVFAPARYVSQKMLAEQNLPVEFVPLPFALYRIDRS